MLRYMSLVLYIYIYIYIYYVYLQIHAYKTCIYISIIYLSIISIQYKVRGQLSAAACAAYAPKSPVKSGRKRLLLIIMKKATTQHPKAGALQNGTRESKCIGCS